MPGSKRRDFLRSGIVSAAGITCLGLAKGRETVADPVVRATAETGGTPPPFHLGLVTYNLAVDWDIETIIQNCTKRGLKGQNCAPRINTGWNLRLAVRAARK